MLITLKTSAFYRQDAKIAKKNIGFTEKPKTKKHQKHFFRVSCF